MPEIMNLKLATGIVAISLLSIFFNAYAGTPESRLLFSINAQNRIRLGVINTSRQTLSLLVSNKEGDVFLKETTKSGTNYFQFFDVSKLPDGEYAISLIGLSQEIKKKFFIENHKVIQKFAFEPIFSVFNGESLRVFYNNPMGKSVKVTIEQNNETVFEDQEIKDIVVNKKYSLKQMIRGNYTVKLSVEDESFYYSFEVK